MPGSLAPASMNGDYDIGQQPLIYYVDPDPAQRQELVRQIRHYGYEVLDFENITEARDAAARGQSAANEQPANGNPAANGQPANGNPAANEQPAALIVDLKFPAGNAVMIIGEILEMREQPIPLVFISDQGDLPYRLQAVRFGGRAYFTKPVEIGALIGVLDELTARRTTEPYHVLIVEHDQEKAAEFSAMLREAGMVTEVIRDPLQIMTAMEDFAPELILMKLYYPSCLGMELATMIRQQEAYHGIPIVFLSRETNPDRRMAAMQRGGDDFLNLPVRSEVLTESVTVRVERFRILRSLTVADNLTGLLNHTALMEKLEACLLRAARRNERLSFAMIDLDNFKKVNERHGLAVGDRVIKNLARLLRQRLRRTDFVGRYGGEEFGVILMDTSGPAALRVLNSIRAGFERIRHRSHKGEFHVTFSCGMASFPEFRDSTSIGRAADDALYVAKEAGRNRVVPADPEETSD